MRFLQKSSLLVILLLALPSAAFAQAYSGERKFDGVHYNELNGSLFGGKNVVTGAFFGENAIYTRHLSPRWSVSAGQQIQFLKNVYSIDVTGTYRIPVGKKVNIYLDGRFLFSRYHKVDVNELYRSFTTASYGEPLVMTLQFGVNIRPRANRWNLGLFFRNFDQYYYENWNINWGIRFHCTLPLDMKLFGELNVRPAGSISQLATRYETSLKLGLKYVWV